MSEDAGRARDVELLDAVDKFAREAFKATVWRVVREGRDPLLGSPSQTRWCNGGFDVLYTSFDRDGAVAEIHSFLALQPVFPSKLRYFAYKVSVRVTQAMRPADLDMLADLGVTPSRYQDRDFIRTQAIADAAYFLGFDGLVAPSARWNCLNLVLFTDRIPPDQIELLEHPAEPVAWEAWRKRHRR
ncbi:MAG TPA: RES family NAD+ phosphorylase [Lichenihabitans sp.]|nr:RES family NAD+ phosphorylase [Lichenihabitans sp.]